MLFLISLYYFQSGRTNAEIACVNAENKQVAILSADIACVSAGNRTCAEIGCTSAAFGCARSTTDALVLN